MNEIETVNLHSLQYKNKWRTDISSHTLFSINIKKLLSWAYALKDTAGFRLFGLPIRINEIILFILIIQDVSKRRIKRINIKEFHFIFLIFCNFIYALFFGILNSNDINSVFFGKYLLRNFFYLFIFFAFSISKTKFCDNDFKYVFHTIVISNIIAGLIFYILGYRFELGHIINYKTSLYQAINIFGNRLYRFCGTASEAGYLGPFITMPLYYYFFNYLENKNNLKEIVVLSLIAIFSFSIYVYLMFIFTCIYAIVRSKKTKRWFSIFFIAILTILLIGVLYFYVEPFEEFLNTNFINKIKSLAGIDNTWDFSGVDRKMHFSNCIRIYNEQSFSKKLFGIGTGGYSKKIFGNSTLLLSAEEAYNIFLSTLLDRGVVGLLLLVSIFFSIAKFHIVRDVFSDSIYIGVLSQYFHWMITGNMWLGYFWIEVLYLIGYYRWRNNG